MKTGIEKANNVAAAGLKLFKDAFDKLEKACKMLEEEIIGHQEAIDYSTSQRDAAQGHLSEHRRAQQKINDFLK